MIKIFIPAIFNNTLWWENHATPTSANHIMLTLSDDSQAKMMTRQQIYEQFLSSFFSFVCLYFSVTHNNMDNN